MAGFGLIGLVQLGAPTLLAWVVSITVVTFVLYGWDKKNAELEGPRTPEYTLHILALVGGTIGAFAGQRIFRHKTQKTSFRVVFWVIVAIQLAVIGWFGYSRYS